MGQSNQRGLVLSKEEIGLVHEFRRGGATAVAAWAWERVENAQPPQERAELIQRIGGRAGQARVVKQVS